jgi:subtilisin-like proprotein convertase family protein
MKWQIFLAPVVMACLTATAQAQSYNGSGGAIPDANPLVPLVSTINVPDNVTVADLTITLNGFGHTWQGDLWARITAPDGVTTMDLFRRAGQGSTSLFGFSNNFSTFNTYVFSDAGATSTYMASPATIPGNTYRAYTNPGANITTTNATGPGVPTQVLQSFSSTFGGTAAQGVWTLRITDMSSGDAGSLGSWTLNITPAPEPTIFSFAGVGLLALLRRRR